MKTITIYLLLLGLVIGLPVRAQIKGNGDVNRQERTLEAFNAIEVGGAREVYITQGDQYKVVVETDANLQEFVRVAVKDHKLTFSTTKPIKNYSAMNFYVTLPELRSLEVSGAAEVKNEGVLSGDALEIVVSGASEVRLKLNVKGVNTVISGASEVWLEGQTTASSVQLSGASEFHAGDLKATTAVVQASGASEATVYAAKALTYGVSGASEVNYTTEPDAVVVKNGKDTKSVTMVGGVSRMDGYQDTTRIKLGTMNFEVIDGDTTIVGVGRHRLVVSDEGDVKWERNRPQKFNGNWGGVDIGLNGYLTPNFDMNFAPADDYLSLRMEKSINVNVNLYEQNIQLSRKHDNFGLITGIGFSWNNYRFSNPTYLDASQPDIAGYYMRDVSVRKTKLTAFYVTVPLFFEVQSTQDERNHRFHFAVGAVAGARLSTHTKIYFNEAGKAYTLNDPVTGQVVAQKITPGANDRNIVKDRDGYHLAPFKLDASVRFGYGIINLFATYGLNTLFQKDRGPELYPFSAGITLAGW